MSQPTLSGAPTLELDHGFVVATGIECSAPTIAGGRRMDELRKTGHWTRVEEDVSLVAGLGVRWLRYGIPFHVVAREPGRFDWAWTDRALGALRDAGVEPVADLLHFGLPDDIRGFGDPRLPGRYRAFVRAFVARYPWIRWYTPVNEPLVGATFSGRLGWWNERATDDGAYVAAIDGSATCAVLGMEAIRERRPDAVFIQSDGCESYLPEVADALPRATFLDERRFVGWDLAYGRRPGAAVVPWLAAHGLGEARLAWYAEHGSSEGCIVGHDYYAGNEWLVRADGSIRQADRRRGYAALAREYHAHFGLPFMLSETNFEGPNSGRWLAETWNDALGLRLEGLPIRGYCWYGFVDHVDWDTCLRQDNGRANACGLVSLDRRRHAVGETYAALATAALRDELRPLPVMPEDADGFDHRSSLPAFVPDLASPRDATA